MYICNSNHFNTKLLGICFKNARFRELSLTVSHDFRFILSLPARSPFPFLPHSQCETQHFTPPNLLIRSCLSELGTDSTAIKLYCWLTGLGFPGGSVVKNPAAKARDPRDMGSIPGSGRSPVVGNATYVSILAWRIPWTNGPGGPQSMGRFYSPQGVRHD